MTAPAFLVGLPHLADGPLLAAARRLRAPLLLSANAFSIWKPDQRGIRGCEPHFGLPGQE